MKKEKKIEYKRIKELNMNYEQYKNKLRKITQDLFKEYMSDSLDKEATYMGKKAEDIDFDIYRAMIALGDERYFNQEAQDYLENKFKDKLRQ